MMTKNRLTKGLYEQGTRLLAGNLFELRRWRADDFCHNAGWFNVNGERIGYGDLSKADIRRISEGLNEGELFIVVSELDMFWTRSDKHPYDPQAPGIHFICEKAYLIIAPKRVLQVMRFSHEAGFYRLEDGLLVEQVRPMDAYKAITRYAGVPA